ncbi:hypothetical protein ETB97_004895 [Aspergillus alliaceus]|uniref:Glucose-methanol-choline oxidoreductase N-terminal domain-containing protein n=1 Tax=Petromyces alliaceus TaxID=209559 RepID=A0A8H5ZZH0_PETAA|nr:hypothetical protein ETB97_004895 [Aspergillus burnettii]
MPRQRNPSHDPHYFATPQPPSGPPATETTAQRMLKGYDYVIVGAGAAGCVLASKLSEDQNVSVLLLEAGGDNAQVRETKVPLMFPKLFHSQHDWNYYTVEQPNLAYRSLYWPRGRILGGSTSMNAMIYHHCSKSDFDEWEQVHGCNGWSYNDLAPYFRSMERFTSNPQLPTIDTRYRGTTGDWQTGHSWLSDIGDKGFVAACQEVGIPATADINTPNSSLGVTRLSTFIDPKGQRSSLATAYLPPSVLSRRNLTVACNTQVTRLLIDRLSKSDPIVIGVETQASPGAERFQVHARREVLLCAGAINTPQLLLLSGIGPLDELQKHGIPIVQTLNAVGRHLKDHLCTTPIICKAKHGVTLDYLSKVRSGLPALARWLLFGSGPLTSNAGEAAAFIRSSDHVSSQSEGISPEDHTSSKMAPDVEIIGAPLGFIHHGEESPMDGSSVFTIVPISLRPKSEGTITLRSREVFDHPLIDPNYLSDDGNNDQAVLLTALRVCLRIMRSPALQRFLEPVPENDESSSYWWPYSSSDIDSISEEQLSRFMKEKAFTLYHPVGTARMGSSPSVSVVDPQCRVHGVGRLRIMDASVFPEQVSGHPTAVIGAMAFKLSDMIKQEYTAEVPLRSNL